MRLTANILTSLAALLFLIPFQYLLATAKPGRGDGAAVWGGLFVLVPMWLLLIVALVLATTRGDLDWLPVKRSLQHTLVIAAGLAMLATAFFAFLGRTEPADQLPFLSRPFVGWADFALPLITIAFLLISLNISPGALMPPIVHRGAFAAIAAVALLHGLGLLGTWFWSAQQQQAGAVRRETAFHADLERKTLREVERLDVEKNTGELVDYAAHIAPEVRQLAVEKLKTHPNLIEAIATALRSGHAEAALGYLEVHGVSDADKQQLAQPVFDGMLALNRSAEREIERTVHFYRDRFDRRARIMIAAAERFADQGHDYVAVLREFRRLLDQGAAGKAPLDAKARLDRWLARQPSARS
jgi:hypothetical protein